MCVGVCLRGRERTRGKEGRSLHDAEQWPWKDTVIVKSDVTCRKHRHTQVESVDCPHHKHTHPDRDSKIHGRANVNKLI